MDTCVNSEKKSKISFCQNWLSDDRYKLWIREVPNEESLFYCSICDNTYSCSSSHVSRHDKSASHIKNRESQQSGLTNIEKSTSKRKFRKQWLEIDDFKPWLQECPNNEYSCFCSVCNINLTPSVSVIQLHADSKRHKSHCQEKGIEKHNDAEEISLSFDDKKKSAEIRFAALIAEKNISYQTAEEILNLFKLIGKEPSVLQSMTMGRTKCGNIVSNVLSVRETNRVVDVLQNNKFSVLIDETSDITNNKWMTFLVRYVDPLSLDVRTELLKLIDLDAKDCSADKLITIFKKEMWKKNIPFQNIIALSCDNASVMTGRISSFKTKLQETCGGKLLTFPCPCHSSALIAHAACATIPRPCEELLRKLVTFINSSPKRLAIFREFQDCFQETDRNLLKLSDTRWLSYQHCVERFLENWDSVLQFLREFVFTEKSKTAENLLSLIQNPELKAYFHFLNYVLSYFNRFNAFFQAQETRIHLLQPRCLELLTSIAEHFLHPEVMQSSSEVKNIDFSKSCNQKPLNEVSVGSECETFLRDLAQKGQVDIVNTVKQNCLQFYVKAAEEIRNRLPIDDEFLSKLQVLTLRKITNKNASFKDVLFISKKLGGFDEVGLYKEWTMLNLDFVADEKYDSITSNFDIMWKNILLQKNQDGTLIFHNLRKLLSAVRSLPNSNADAERCFSMLPDVKTKKRNKLCATSVNAICVFKSALKARGETALTMKIDEEHLALMKSENLYQQPNRRLKGTLQLHSSITSDLTDHPSTSS